MWQSDLSAFTLGLLWEVKDGYIPCEKHSVLGSDGFSTTDLKVNAGTIIINRLVKFSLTKTIQFVKKHSNVRLANK